MLPQEQPNCGSTSLHPLVQGSAEARTKKCFPVYIIVCKPLLPSHIIALKQLHAVLHTRSYQGHMHACGSRRAGQQVA